MVQWLATSRGTAVSVGSVTGAGHCICVSCSLRDTGGNNATYTGSLALGKAGLWRRQRNTTKEAAFGILIRKFFLSQSATAGILFLIIDVHPTIYPNECADLFKRTRVMDNLSTSCSKHNYFLIL